MPKFKHYRRRLTRERTPSELVIIASHQMLDNLEDLISEKVEQLDQKIQHISYSYNRIELELLAELIAGLQVIYKSIERGESRA